MEQHRLLGQIVDVAVLLLLALAAWRFFAGRRRRRAARHDQNRPGPADERPRPLFGGRHDAPPPGPSRHEIFSARCDELRSRLLQTKEALPVDRCELAQKLGIMLDKYRAVVGDLILADKDTCEELSESCEELFKVLVDRIDAVQCIPTGAGEQSLFIESRAIMDTVVKSFCGFIDSYAEIVESYSDPEEYRQATFATLKNLAGKIYLAPAFVQYVPRVEAAPVRSA